MENIIVKKIDKEELNSFISFQYKLYKKDPNFRPELRKEQMDFFTTNPFLKEGQVSFYLAFKNNIPVGRIAKILLPKYPVMFGFFECIDDFKIVEALFNEIDENRGLIGPLNFTTNDNCGLLIEGFEYPSFNMPYNKSYYQKFFEQYGLKKKMDLFAYYVPKKTIPEKFRKKIQEIEIQLNKAGIIVRKVDFNNFKEEVKHIVDVYNDSNSENWGFLPISVEDGEYIAKRLKKITAPEYVYLAEKQGEFIGYLVGVPDINEIVFKNGRISIKALFQILFFKPKRIRIIILGVRKAYRQKGIAACMIEKIVQITHLQNIDGAEASYILENNKEMNLILRKINGKITKKYRIYEKVQ